MKLEEEQRVKERIREEEFAAAAAASKSQENASLPSRPLATVTPRENSAGNREQERKERERQREKRRSERDGTDSNRKAAAVQLPNESSSGRGVKVHTVSPLYASYPVVVERASDRTEETAAPEASISPNPPAEEEKRAAEFSLGALEAMAALKQRTAGSPVPPEQVFTKPEEEVTVPLDLSEASVRVPEVTSQPEICQEATTQIEDPVRSLLDVRVERWKRKRQQSDAGEEEVDDDLDEEMCPDLSESVVSLSVEQCLKTYPIPAGVSEEQHHFLHMFGLVTPQKRSGTFICYFTFSK